MPFKILIDKIRRNKIKNGLFSTNPTLKLEGMKVINGYINKLK